MQASHVHTMLNIESVSVLGMPRRRFALHCGLRGQARPKQTKNHEQKKITKKKAKQS